MSTAVPLLGGWLVGGNVLAWKLCVSAQRKRVLGGGADVGLR